MQTNSTISNQTPHIFTGTATLTPSLWQSWGAMEKPGCTWQYALT
jgi:hypothetical protein